MGPLAALAIALTSTAPRSTVADDPASIFFAARSAPVDIWDTSWPTCADDAPHAPRPALHLAMPVTFQQDAPQPVHAAAIEHSDGFLLRAKIHKYASYATLPLFAAQLALGESLSNNVADSGGRRAAHAVVGTGIVGLFGVNTVTGAWNLFGEDRQDPNGRTLRLVHGLLMMVADAGFVASVQTGPNDRSVRGAATYTTDVATHRTIAITSIGVASAGYLIMLFGNR